MGECVGFFSPEQIKKGKTAFLLFQILLLSACAGLGKGEKGKVTDLTGDTANGSCTSNGSAEVIGENTADGVEGRHKGVLSSLTIKTSDCGVMEVNPEKAKQAWGEEDENWEDQRQEEGLDKYDPFVPLGSTPQAESGQ